MPEIWPPKFRVFPRDSKKPLSPFGVRFAHQVLELGWSRAEHAAKEYANALEAPPKLQDCKFKDFGAEAESQNARVWKAERTEQLGITLMCASWRMKRARDQRQTYISSHTWLSSVSTHWIVALENGSFACLQKSQENWANMYGETWYKNVTGNWQQHCKHVPQLVPDRTECQEDTVRDRSEPSDCPKWPACVNGQHRW